MIYDIWSILLSLFINIINIVRFNIINIIINFISIIMIIIIITIININIARLVIAPLCSTYFNWTNIPRCLG